MKKTFPILLVILFFTGCSQPQPETYQVEIGMFTPYYLFPETLNGQVKEVYERSYLAHEENGQLVKGERLTVAARDTVGWTNDFHLLYDEDGNMIQADLIDENDELIDRNKQTIEEGKVVQSTYIKDDTVRYVMKIEFADDGNLIDFKAYRMPEDTLVMTRDYIYNENGHLVERRNVNFANEVMGKYVFTVNDEGKRTGYQFFNKDGEKMIEQQFTYNDMGSMSEQVIILDEGDRYVSEYAYEYDDMGNWIVVKCHTTEQPDIITERAITYY
jgi:hypothetical protein